MLLLGLGLLLACAGLLILYPASALLAERELSNSDFFFHRQVGWMVIGLPALLLWSAVPIKLLRRLALPGLMLVIVMLGLVFVPGIGQSVSSSRDCFHRWLDLGPISMQPSELAKIALVVYSAHILTRNNELQREYDMRRLVPPLAVLSIMLVLIILEPQYGTSICMLVVLAMMVYLSGFPMLRLVWLGLASLPLLAILVFFWEYRFERFRVWLDPYAYRYEGGYQLVTSFRAFEEGGWFGQSLASGFGHRYLTYGYNDFILALFAEDFGFIGIVVLFGLMMAFLLRAFLTLKQIQEPFPFMLGAGSLIMIFFQILVNCAVVTGLVPTTGVSLPFISYGGTSLIVTMSFLGLLFNVSRHAHRQGPGAEVFRSPALQPADPPLVTARS
ncbi:MAG: cell division protein FtsW [Leptospiraceae bacterium]|nr:cell division protein FtsW [Leptospiraceae bacterium]